MTMTVRHRAELLALDDGHPIDTVVAVIWFDPDEETGAWGGIIEPATQAAWLREQLLGGQPRYRLALDDGRSGIIALAVSPFEADGEHPLMFAGEGRLGR
jgi:hypothetical protein